jgi:hypothetical protein
VRSKISTSRDGNSNATITNNQLEISNGVTITALGGDATDPSGDKVNSVGIFIGSPRAVNDIGIYTIQNNQVFVTADDSSLDNTIDVISIGGWTYGIWVDAGTGNNITVSNTKFSSNNNTGAAIHYSDGHEDSWAMWE